MVHQHPDHRPVVALVDRIAIPRRQLEDVPLLAGAVERLREAGEVHRARVISDERLALACQVRPSDRGEDDVVEHEAPDGNGRARLVDDVHAHASDEPIDLRRGDEAGGLLDLKRVHLDRHVEDARV